MNKEYRLYQAVLLQALKDLQDNPQVYLEEIVEFINSDEFETIVRNADLCPIKVKRTFEQKISEVVQ